MTREEAIKEIKSWDFLEGKEIEAIETLIPELLGVCESVEQHGYRTVCVVETVVPVEEAVVVSGSVEEDSVESVYRLVRQAVKTDVQEFITEEESVSCLLACDLTGT